MGNSDSSQPEPLYKEPWRMLSGETILDFVKGYRPKNSDVEHIRILLHGPVGAGKSSFINSVDSILQGHICVRAPVDGISTETYTQEYKTYKISNGDGGFYSFVFNDTMGLEKDFDAGVMVEDMKLLLGGHVEENYKFQSNRSVREAGYRHNPTLQDRVHVLVFVVPAEKVKLLSDEVWKKLREVRLEARQTGIPQIALITKVDECPEVGDKIENVHKSKNLKEQVELVHKSLGISPNCIFLVKNYHQELQLNNDTNHLILTALKQMLHFGEDFLNNLQTN
ncbi:interferon-induced protein 44-like [Cynoglossus semilaevis]|uniref:interferon-induced protein 44-like n=1 Tax=Cynoglossus semilaevis TaxID=244447 RepID=UPI0004975B56|nr:interferon-induced protein 44-like [Cynoglossus semilaevis]